MSALIIQVSDSLRRMVERFAAEAGISVDHFFSIAAAEKLDAREAHYLSRRAARADRYAYLRVMAKVPAVLPVAEWDQLLPDWPPDGWNEKVSKVSS